MSDQGELLPVTHDSLQQSRLKKYRDVNPERIYMAEWKRLNRRSPGVNGGFTYLEHILTPDGQLPRTVSRRDAQVAASVIQWLGTNCGMGFMRECERKIDAAREDVLDKAERIIQAAKLKADLERQKPARGYFE
jgi:hypothetical protein